MWNSGGGEEELNAPWRRVRAALLCLPLLVACGGADESAPNILFITVDTLRADRLGCYGYDAGVTPNIDALADDGVLFESAYCDVTWTLPSMSSTFTGTTALRHGVRSYYDVLEEENTTVAEIVKEAGYATAAVVAAYPVDTVFGFGQGFDHYDQEFTAAIFHDPGREVKHVESRRGKNVADQMEFALLKAQNDSWRPDDEVTNAALETLENLAGTDKPFFLWVHYFGPHAHPHAGEQGEKNREKHLSTYSLKVTNSDYQVGRLLDALADAGLKDRTLVILHADHGESLGEHGYVGHGAYLYENNLRIPLIMQWPGHFPGGKRIRALVGNIDIAPTILDAAGVEASGSPMDGKSLLELIRTGRPVREEAYFETYMPAHFGFTESVDTPEGEIISVGVRRRGIVQPPWKYIFTEPFPIYADEVEEIAEIYRNQVIRRELYNLEEDPGEMENLADREAEKTAFMAGRLATYGSLEAPPGKDEKALVPEDHLEKLKSLGYVQ